MDGGRSGERVYTWIRLGPVQLSQIFQLCVSTLPVSFSKVALDQYFEQHNEKLFIVPVLFSY